jgi:hypothetical protein
LDLEVNQQVIEKQIEDNVKNGHEYARLIETPYWSLMLDRQVLKIEGNLIGHKSFLPQEVVQQEIWITGF